MKVTGCLCFQGCAGLLCSFSQKSNLEEINDIINHPVDFSLTLTQASDSQQAVVQDSL